MRELLEETVGDLRWIDMPRLLLAWYVGMCAAFLFHELGHCVAGWAVGFPPREVHVGDWGPEFVGHLGDTRFVLRPLSNPVGQGYNTFGVGTVSMFSVVLILLAGAAVNIVVGLAVGALALWLRSAVLLAVAVASLGLGLGQMVPVGSLDGGLVVRMLKTGSLGDPPPQDSGAAPP